MHSTIRNFGHYSRRLYFLDDNYLDVSETNVAEYYGTDSNIPNGPLACWKVRNDDLIESSFAYPPYERAIISG